MNADLLQKYKDLEEKIKTIVLILQKTSTLVNAKIQAQLNLLTKSTEPAKTAQSIKQAITHYTHFMDSLGMLVLTSVKAAFNRKLMKSAKQKDLKKYFDKWKDANVDFWNHAKSTVDPLEYFASVFDPRPSNDKKKVSSISDIVKLVSTTLEDIKKITDTLAKDKKLMSAFGGFDESSGIEITGMLGGYDIVHGADDLEEAVCATPLTDSTVQANLAKIELIKRSLEKQDFNSASDYLENVVLPTQLDIMGPDTDNDNDNLIILRSVKHSKLFNIFDQDLTTELENYIKKHENQYAQYINLSKSHENKSDLKIGGSGKTVIKALDQVKNYLDLMNQIKETDKHILIGNGIEEFIKADSCDSVSKVLQQHSQLQQTHELIQRQDVKRPRITSEIQDNLQQAETRLSQVLKLCSQTSTLTPLRFPNAPKTSKSSDLDILKIQTAVNKMQSWMNFVKKNIESIHRIEQHVHTAAKHIEKSHQLISELIGPSVETCVMRPARIMSALVYKDVMSQILDVRFSSSEKLSDVKKYLNELKITEQHPSVHIYNNGLKIHELRELAEKLL